MHPFNLKAVAMSVATQSFLDLLYRSENFEAVENAIRQLQTQVREGNENIHLDIAAATRAIARFDELPLIGREIANLVNLTGQTEEFAAALFQRVAEDNPCIIGQFETLFESLAQSPACLSLAQLLNTQLKDKRTVIRMHNAIALREIAKKFPEIKTRVIKEKHTERPLLESLLKALMHARNSEPVGIRMQLFFALEYLGETDAVLTLVLSHLPEHSIDWYQGTASHILTHVLPKAKYPDKILWRFLKELESDRNPRAKVQILISLEEMGPLARAAQTTLEQLAKNDDTLGHFAGRALRRIDPAQYDRSASDAHIFPGGRPPVGP